MRCIESFKVSRDGKRVGEVIENGGIVACAVPSGCLLLCRADCREAVQKIENWHNLKDKLCFCVPELKEAWQIWKETASKNEINDFLSYLHLEHVIIVSTVADTFAYHLGNYGDKAAVWIGQKGTINSVLRSLRRCLAGRFINLDDETNGNNFEEALAGCDLFIGNSNQSYYQEKLIIDLSSYDWRIIQRGIYSLAELKSYTKRNWLLSGDSLRSNKFNRLSLTNVVLCVGDEEKISRRFCHFYEDVRNSKEAVFFVNSESVHKALHEFNVALDPSDSISEVYPLFDASLVKSKEYLQKRSRELLEKLNYFRCNDETNTIYIEAVDEEIGGDFLEKVKKIAGQVMYLDGSGRWESDSALSCV